MSEIDREKYKWKLPRIFKTFKLYLGCGFYRTLIFSLTFYPFLILSGSKIKKIQFQKNEVLKKEITEYIKRKYGIIFAEVSGPFALVGLIEIFPKNIYGYFPVTKEDMVYDLGATVGEFSLKSAKEGAHVLSLEMDRTSFSSMIKNIKTNNFEDKITASLCRVDDKRNSIDSFFKKTKKAPTLVKIDVEGDELKVLNGAREVLRKYHPKIILETHSLELEKSCTNLLKSYGYKLDHKIDMNSKNHETKVLFMSTLA